MNASKTEFDTLILGTSLSGLVTALFLAEKRRKVALLALDSSISEDSDEGELLLTKQLGSYLKRAKVPVQDIHLQDTSINFLSPYRFKQTRSIHFKNSLKKFGHVFENFLEALFMQRNHLPLDDRKSQKDYRRFLSKFQWDEQEMLKLSESLPHKELSNLGLYRFDSQEKSLIPQLLTQTGFSWGYSDPSSIKHALYKKLKEYGVQLVACDEIISFKEFGEQGVCLEYVSEENKKLKARSLVVAGHSQAIEKLLPKYAWKRNWRKSFHASKPSAYKVMQRYWLNAEMLPQNLTPSGMSHLESNTDSWNKRKYPRIFRHLLKKDRNDKVCLCLSTFVTELNFPKDRIAQEFENMFLKLVPFAKTTTVERDEAPYIPFDENEVGDLRDPFLYSDELKWQENCFSFQSPKSRYENVFLSSREVLPSLGTDGDLLVGLHVGKLVQQGLQQLF